MKTVLVIEDNEYNLNLVKAILKNIHCDVFCRTDAQSGIDFIKDKHPDLTIMDIQLPGMNGLDAIKVLRDDPLTKNLKVISLTALAMDGDQELMLRSGFDGYLSKPFHYQELITLVEKMLGDNKNDSN
jgi:two-component system, cell cycle response regulator DivK